MNRIWVYFIVLVTVLASAYFMWARLGRQFTNAPAYAGKVDIQEFGADSARGNIISIQPFMQTEDYASEKTFRDALQPYLESAAKKGWLHKNTVVSFPEYLGTWLVVAGEKKSVFEAQTVKHAMDIMAMSDLFTFLPEYISCKAADKSAEALFRMKAPDMAAIYNSVFSGFARQYGVTIVAGSIVLPDPQIKNGVLTVHDSSLYNISVVYRPDGTPDEKIARKAFPVADELPFTCTENAGNIPVYSTPAGKMAVLICADSWYQSCYKNAVAEHADFVVVPSYVEGDSAFKQPWPGYSGFKNPADIDKNDIGKITILDGWLRYALPGRMKQAGLQNGIITFLHGHFWDLGSDMHFVLVKQGETIVKQPSADASVVNLWL